MCQVWAQMPWACTWGAHQPIKPPVLSLLSHFSSSFKIKIMDILRWVFLFSVCNFFISLLKDLMAKSNVHSWVDLPSILYYPLFIYFSKLSFGLIQWVVSKVLHSIKLWALLLWGAGKNNVCCSLLSQTPKRQKTELCAQLSRHWTESHKYSWGSCFLTPLPSSRS